MSDGMLLPGDLDPALCDMIRHAIMDITAWIDAEGGGHQGSFTLDDVEWDSPAAVPEDAIIESMSGRPNLERFDIAQKASHAIGFLCGIAAALNITPRTLLDSYEERKTTLKALADLACVSDPDMREHAERAMRMLDRLTPSVTATDGRKLVYVKPGEVPPGATIIDGHHRDRAAREAKRAKRPTSKRRQKLPRFK